MKPPFDFGLADLRVSLSTCRHLFTDVSLVCSSPPDSQVIRGHRIILAAFSDFFRSTFERRPRDDEVYLVGVDHHVLEAVVKFIYTGETPSEEKSFDDFVALALKLHVKGLPSTDAAGDMNTEEGLGNQVSQNKPALNITELPEEVLLDIFSFLSVRDLMKNVCLVNKLFKQLTRDKGAYKRVTIDDGMNLRKAASFFIDKTLIEDLVLLGNKRECEEGCKYFLRTVIPRLRNLRTIDVSSLWLLDSKVVAMLGEVPMRSVKLESISAACIDDELEEDDAESKEDDDTVSTWNHPTSLRHLKLSSGGTLISKIALTTTKLLTLIFESRSGDVPESLGDAIRSSSQTLCQISISRCALGDPELETICTCRSLKTLKIECLQGSVESLRLVSSLANLRNLNVFLSSLQYSAADVAAFVPSLTMLESFSLFYEKPDDHLMSALAELNQLKELEISSSFYSGVGSVSDRGFFEVYTKLVNLEKLTFQVKVAKTPRPRRGRQSLSHPNLKCVRIADDAFLPRKMIKDAVRETQLGCWFSQRTDNLFVKLDVNASELKSVFPGFGNVKNIFAVY